MNPIQPHDPAEPPDASLSEGDASGATARIEAILAAGAAAAPAFLVVAGASAHASGWGARAAIEFATRAAERDRPVILIDLDLREPGLHELVGEYNDEGISDVTLFGVSLHRAARTLEGHPFRFVPAGPFILNPSEVLRNPRWTLILAEAAGMDALVIAYIPADASGLQEIAKKLRHAVVLARPDERGTLPRGCTVLGVIDPPAPEAAPPEAAPAPEAAPIIAEPAPIAVAAPVFVDAAPPAQAAVAEPEAAPAFVEAAPAIDEAEPEAFEDDEEGVDDTLFIEDDEPLDLRPREEAADEDDAIDDDPVVLRGADVVLLDAALPLAPEAPPTPLPRAENALPLVPDGAPPRDTVTGVVYSVPRLPAWKEQMIRTIAVLTLGYGTYYIIWRWTATLNPDALWFSIPLVLAETWGLLTAFVMVISVWKLQHRDTLPPPADMSVDVFITTYDEPLEVIRRTAVGARAIRYPHNTYLLDDGKRDEVRAVAEELGIGYLRRPDNAHAKAGNLNYALQHTSGEFVLQLDADHVPLPHILHRLLGFFEHDPKLAFVQAPQDFYNTDGFTYEVNEEWQRIWEEQRLFFSVIQPGKDRLNCAFFCGSCAVFRREALEEVGGFATQTVTEDIETSLLLHARGWRSLFYGESLAYGLAAGSATAFHVQHLRWGQGAMQVLRKVNPLTRPGLTLAQRISYFGSLTAYVGGVQKLVFYSAPIVFFLTGALPIRAIDREFLIRFVPFLLLSFVLSDMMARGTANTWASERYQMAKFWTYTRAVASIFRRKPGRFTVTPKGPGHVPFRTYAPHVALMALSATAVVWATFAHRLGWVDYGTPGWSSAAFRANFMWAGLNFILAASVVDLSLRVRQRRGDHRFRDQFPIRVRVYGNGKPRSHVGLSEDLNPGGMAFRSGEALVPGARLRITLPLTTGRFELKGHVMHTTPLGGTSPPMYRTGVRFHDVPIAVRDAVELHCTHHAVPLERAQYRGSLQLLDRAAERMRNARRETRTRVDLPARVWFRHPRAARGETQRRVAILAEVSAGGARLVMDEPLPPGTRVRYFVPGTEIRGQGRAVFSHATETPIGVRFAIGVRRRKKPRPNPHPENKMLPISRALKVALPFLLVAAAAAPVAAQGGPLQAVIYGGTELDTQDLRLFLAGIDVHTNRPGLGVGVGVMAYNLTYPVVEDRTESVNGVQPSVSLRYQWPTSSVSASVGYLFMDGENEVLGAGAPGGARDGVVASLQAISWGDGSRSIEGIASYNFDAEYAWTRVRGSKMLNPSMDGRGLSLGAELVLQGTTADDTYRAIQVGPVAELAITPGMRLIGVVGGKADNRLDAPSVFPYFKAEFVLIPGL